MLNNLSERIEREELVCQTMLQWLLIIYELNYTL